MKFMGKQNFLMSTTASPEALEPVVYKHDRQESRLLGIFEFLLVNALFGWVSSQDIWYPGIPVATFDGIFKCLDGVEHLSIPIWVSIPLEARFSNDQLHIQIQT